MKPKRKKKETALRRQIFFFNVETSDTGREKLKDILSKVTNGLLVRDFVFLHRGNWWGRTPY